MGDSIGKHGTVEMRLIDQLYETCERLRHVGNDAIAAAERLKAENAKLRVVADAARCLVAALPQCDTCGSPATRAWERGKGRWCDERAVGAPEYPRAKALRDTVASLKALEAL